MANADHFAQELRELVDELRKGAQRRVPRKGAPVPAAQPRGDRAGLLSVSYPSTRMSDPVLDEQVREQLERVVVEQRQHDRLRAQGFRPLRRVLLIGPPGTRQDVLRKRSSG